MSSIADLCRPSSVLLLAVIAANLVLPLAYWSSSEVASDQAAPAGVAQQRPAFARPVERLAPVSAPAPAVERVALHKPAPVCRAWGPFTEVTEAEGLAARLQLASEDFEVFQAQVEADPDYLVTVRAPGTREAADRVLRELHGRDIDSYILERGPSSNVLAVGVFSAPDGAQAQQQRLADLGYQAVVEPLERSHRIYHLLARLPADLEPEIAPAGACGDIAPLQQFL